MARNEMKAKLGVEGHGNKVKGPATYNTHSGVRDSASRMPQTEWQGTVRGKTKHIKP